MTTKAGLHWLWRGAIVLILAVALKLILVTYSYELFGEGTLEYQVWRAVRLVVGARPVAFDIASAITYTAPTLTICLAAFALLSRRSIREACATRCRKCRHILQGLKEPRCPECGEVI